MRLLFENKFWGRAPSFDRVRRVFARSRILVKRAHEKAKHEDPALGGTTYIDYNDCVQRAIAYVNKYFKQVARENLVCLDYIIPSLWLLLYCMFM